METHACRCQRGRPSSTSDWKGSFLFIMELNSSSCGGALASAVVASGGTWASHHGIVGTEGRGLHTLAWKPRRRGWRGGGGEKGDHRWLPAGLRCGRARRGVLGESGGDGLDGPALRGPSHTSSNIRKERSIIETFKRVQVTFSPLKKKRVTCLSSRPITIPKEKIYPCLPSF